MKHMQHSEEETEDALWRITIYRFYARKDLEELIDLRDGPECLSDGIKELLNKFISELEKENERKESQAER